MNCRSLLIYLSLFLFTAFVPGAGCFDLHAQYENVWAFGQKAGLDFNPGNPVFVHTSIDGFGEANASVCNEQGQLLFYTEGTIAWNRNGDKMADSLVPIRERIVGTTTPTSSSCQGTVIVPMPGSDSRYYIFSLFSIEYGTDYGRLYYSIVDMSLNNGLGGVDPGQKAILLDSSLKEQMTAVSGDEYNVWLMLKTQKNVFKAYNISACGIDSLPQQSPGMSSRFGGGVTTGQIVFSPDGRKMAVSYLAGIFGSVGGGAELYDFDPLTGKVSNPQLLVNGEGQYGAAFSPDNSKLYIGGGDAGGLIYQIDLTSSDTISRRRLIGISSFSQLKLAPDGKIYFVYDRGQRWLGTIDFPDRPGNACGYTANAIQIPEGSNLLVGFPNVIAMAAKDTTTYTPITTDIQAPCWIDPSIGYFLHGSKEGWDHLWNDGSTTADLLINEPGKYWVSYYAKPCRFQVDTFIVTFPGGVLPSIAIEASCHNAANGRAKAYTYPGDTVIYHYTWRNNRNDILSATADLQNVPAGKYSLAITTAQCDTLLYIDIPEVEGRVSFAADSLACIIDTIQFQNTSDPYYTNFVWSFGDSTFSVLPVPTHRYKQAGQYEVRLIGKGSQCSDTAYKSIVTDAQLPVFFLPGSDSICVGQHITFTSQHEDHTLMAQSWAWGDGSGMELTNEVLVKHAYDIAGIMPVTLSSHFRACPDASFTDTIYVEQLPLVDLGIDSFLCLNYSPVILESKFFSPDLHYLWNTGDTTSSIRIVQPGVYTLTASTKLLGCSTTETVEVKKSCYTDIPNAFTPNGDGYNDYFFPRQLLSRETATFKMQVFDRWGQLLFETSGIEGRGWDGRYIGKEQPQGVYVYRVEVTLKGNRPERYEGNITLIR